MRLAVPTIWEIASLFVGFIGILLAVRGDLQFELGGAMRYLAPYLLSSPLLIISAKGIADYTERLRYMLRYYGVDQTITFRAENTDGNRIIPSGYSERTAHMKTSDRNYSIYQRTHLVTESFSKRALDFLNEMNHEANFILPQRGRMIIRKLDVRPQLSEFRTLHLNLKLPDEFVPTYRKFYIQERMKLPNTFNENTEFYEVSNITPVERLNVKLLFLDIPVSSARYTIYKGTRRTKSEKIPLKPNKINGATVWIAEKTWYNPEIGIKIRIEWDWNLDCSP